MPPLDDRPLIENGEILPHDWIVIMWALMGILFLPLLICYRGPRQLEDMNEDDHERSKLDPEQGVGRATTVFELPEGNQNEHLIPDHLVADTHQLPEPGLSVGMDPREDTTIFELVEKMDIRRQEVELSMEQTKVEIKEVTRTLLEEGARLSHTLHSLDAEQRFIQKTLDTLDKAAVEDSLATFAKIKEERVKASTRQSKGGPGVKSTGLRGSSGMVFPDLTKKAPPRVAFSDRTKKEAASLILEESKSLTVPELFEKMVERGHPVKNPNALRSCLSKEDVFVKRGFKRWGLQTTE